MVRSTLARTALAAAALCASFAAAAQDQVLNLYSARHYQTDEALYADFTKSTGIKINRVDADDAGLLARLRSEGASSPADVILLVDAARIILADADGLFQPVKSSVLASRIPAQLRGKDDGQGSQWFGFSTRARVIVFNKGSVKRDDVDTYEELADPKNKGKVCTRSGSHPYNLSLFGSMYEHLGAQKTEAWLKGVVDNMARAPKGGDTDQIKAVASGECGIALTNSYYLARLMRSEKPEDKAVVEKIEVVFPNQQSWGTHVNIAGGALARHAKNRDAGVKFLEYLSTNSAQTYFANGNNEYPVVPGVKVANPALDALGAFKAELIPISVVGLNSIRVQQSLDRVGYK
ncbi:Fe(3+) ABC transporter substrate-binding protein [Methylibium petroleiphilum]|uniref:Putative iron binding protein component of ABC iron transporter n=1 Tax=Methylibium petroleiphilum (strain ATCC BAA-1232 / LMG 22953 / PM1) TaxID=420662 RepID=A2SFJ4_METPP|nr:Fe(3+) ABC transporter substrate-binding protein [Methylibium petroleiphilum]ABM94333.1 putative iron binding protein component of ABC iron transporter [Methylibium petroleiphilum PM1]